MRFQQRPKSPLLPARSRLWLSGATIISLVLGSSSTPTCHCLYNYGCNPDGSCPYGCDRGWYGPGCQLGNLAFRKPATQSSTFQSYNASLAVNGAMPPYGDASAIDCSHTAESYSVPLWWYVKLSDTEDFVIKNVTIVNRQGLPSKFLRWFYILYTTSVTENPDPSTWATCTYQASAPYYTSTTFVCDRTAIGRRVAVYIGSHPEEVQMLILCEVYVDGYAYKEASSFQDIRTSLTPGCNSVKIDIDNLPIVPPSFFYVYIRPSDSFSVSRVERFRYPLSGRPSAIVSATPGRQYNIWVSPETCCIGSYCLNNVNEGDILSSYCVVGTSSGVAVTITPQRDQYSPSVSANVVNITAVNVYPCKASAFNIQCNRVPRDWSFSTICNSFSCPLNPYYNYTCNMQATFSDGFQLSFTPSVNFVAADISAADISLRSTCDNVHVEVKNITVSWKLNASYIAFFKKALDTNHTTVIRKPFGESEGYSVDFSAFEDSNYTVWAAPETCWSESICRTNSNRACFESSKCAIGRNTSMKYTTTKLRQYSLKLHGCCMLLDVQSPGSCENPDYLRITCSDGGENTTYESSGIIGNPICDLPKGSNYTCQIDVMLGNLNLKNISFRLTNDSLLCESTTMQQSMIPIIGGASGGGLVLIIVITLAVALTLRKKNITQKAKTGLPSTTLKAEGVKNVSYIEDECNSTYIYADDGLKERQREEASSRIQSSSSNDVDEYYVSYVSEHSDSGNTKDTQKHITHNSALGKDKASYVNDEEKQLGLSKTVAPESYADYRFDSKRSPGYKTKELFQQVMEATASTTQGTSDTEENYYMNFSQLKGALGYEQPVSSMAYSNVGTDGELAITNLSDGLSYMNSESTQKLNRKPKGKTGAKK